MKAILSTTALASMIVVSGLFVTTPSFAQDNQPCVGENCPGSNMPDQGGGKKRLKGIDQNEQIDNQNESTDQPRKKRAQGAEQENNEGDVGQLQRKKRARASQQDNDVDVNVDADVRVGTQQNARRGDWKFDSNRHQRRRSKDATFRFYFGGYYYPQPYWEVYSVGGRVSCGEGRAIVAARFNRVRVVECRGGTYTYLGRRHGDTYRVLLNSRTGRIVGRALI